MMHAFCRIFLLGVFGILTGLAQTDPLDDYNVVWDSPSKDAAGSMPIGNGDICLNVWIEEGGDLAEAQTVSVDGRKCRLSLKANVSYSVISK